MPVWTWNQFLESLNKPDLTDLSDEDLIQNAISLSKEFYGSLKIEDAAEDSKYYNDHLALVRVLKAIREKHNWWNGKDIPTEKLLQE